MTGSLLRKFARKGVVVEGRGALLASAIAATLTVAAAPVHAGPVAHPHSGGYDRPLVMPDDPGMGILHKDTGAAPTSTFARPATPATKYRDVMRDIAMEVESEFPGAILIVDRSRSPEAESERIFRKTGVRPLPQDVAEIGRSGPHSFGVAGPKATICAVIGAPAEMTPEQFMVTPGEKPTKASPIDEAMLQRMVTWHEVGHCLLGANEAKADVFSALKMLQETGSAAFLDITIVNREIGEWFGERGDEHVISPALRTVKERYATTEFMKAKNSLRELGAIADKIALPAPGRIAQFRDAVAKAMPPQNSPRPPMMFAPVKEGMVATSMAGWMRASSSVPEMARMTRLLDWMSSDPENRKLPEPFVPDVAASNKAVAALAAAGDPMMRRIAPLLGIGQAQLATAVNEAPDLPSKTDVEGRLVAFNRAGTTVAYSADMAGFLVRDAITRAPLIAGDAFNGVTREFTTKRHAAVTHAADDWAPPRP